MFQPDFFVLYEFYFLYEIQLYARVLTKTSFKLIVIALYTLSDEEVMLTYLFKKKHSSNKTLVNNLWRVEQPPFHHRTTASYIPVESE